MSSEIDALQLIIDGFPRDILVSIYNAHGSEMSKIRKQLICLKADTDKGRQAIYERAARIAILTDAKLPTPGDGTDQTINAIINYRKLLRVYTESRAIIRKRLIENVEKASVVVAKRSNEQILTGCDHTGRVNACEVCNKSLCGYCKWDKLGHTYCDDHVDTIVRESQTSFNKLNIQ